MTMTISVGPSIKIQDPNHGRLSFKRHTLIKPKRPWGILNDAFRIRKLINKLLVNHVLPEGIDLSTLCESGTLGGGSWRAPLAIS